MNTSWCIHFWFRLLGYHEDTDRVGVISSYESVTVFLTTKHHTIGIHDGQSRFNGPRLSGLENHPWVCFDLSKDQSKVTLYLNGTMMLGIDGAEIVYNLEEFDIPPSDPSRVRPIVQDLSEWVKKRESMFKMKVATTDDYIILDANKQAEQLQHRVQALEDLLQSFREGKDYFFDDILANLRVLVFYKQGSKSYDPLLLRIAAFKQLTLPVYVIPDDEHLIEPLIDSTEDMPRFAGFSLAMPYPEIPCVKMVDLQDFLEKPVMFYEGQFLSPLELIEKAATKQSTAHFDQTVPQVIEGIRDTPRVFGYNSLEYYFLSFAEVVAAVGRHVLTTH
jgi:hypothetical protein